MGGVDVRAVGLDRLETCLAIRRRVFVQGQGVPEAIEIDGLDPGCAHFLAQDGARAVGTARLREVDGAAKVERVAVLESERGRGIGRVLMRALEAEAGARGLGEVVLNAQEAVIPFYERLGYASEGERFFEADIPHRRMRKRLRSVPRD
jgi:predicted GNAT family N-acyltransferase